MTRPQTTRPGQTPSAAGRLVPPSNHDAITKAARGIPDRTASTLSFVAGTRTFTITPASGAFDYYIAGRRYIKSAAESIVIADTSGPHWIYYDGATLSSVVNANHATVDDLIVNTARIGIVYWNATDGAGHLVADERHGTEMSGATQEWFHDTTGAVWEDGLALSGYTLDTDSDAGVDFEVTDGLIRDEDLELTIVDGAPATQYAQQLNGGNAEVPIAYRDDVDGTWTQDAATTLPYKRLGAGRLAYNKDDGDGTWSQVEVTNNRFVLATLVATNDWQYPIKMVQGQAEYIDKKTAIEDANAEQVAWGTMLTPEIVPLYRLVMETGDALGGTNKCRIVAITDLRRLSISGGLASPAEPHELLNGNTHPDTLAGTVVRGDLQIGNATPVWARVALGAAGTFLYSDGSDAAWSALAALLTGRAGGQTLQGGTAGSEDLTLESTAHATKGQVISADNHKFVKGAGYDALYDMGNVNGNITIDWLTNGNVQKITLTGNVTGVAFTNPPGPCTCKLWIHQDGTGGRTVAGWDADVDWGGAVPIVSIGANHIDLGVFEYDGGSIYLSQLVQGKNGLGFG